MAARLTGLLACCMWGALGGWAAAIAVTQPDVWSGAPPAPTLLVYGAVTWFGSGYLLGSIARGRPPSRFALRVAGVITAVAFAAKGLAPSLAAWTAVLIAGAAFGALTGMIRTR